MGLIKEFNKKTVVVSVFSGFVYAIGFWTVIYMRLVTQATWVFYLPPILATLFLLPLFLFPVNLIIEREEGGFGDDEVKFRRNILFLLMALQFVPLICAVGLICANDGLVDSNILTTQLMANSFFLLSALVLKFGNYTKPESSFM